MNAQTFLNEGEGHHWQGMLLLNRRLMRLWCRLRSA